MKIDVKTIGNTKKGDIELADSVFAIEPREDIVARVVKYQLAKRRAGTHLVKGRSDVSKTGKKMFRQKGTGRARAGNGSVSQFRGGGVVHGPVLRSHGHSLPKKIRNLGMKSVLSEKLAAGKLIIVDDVSAHDCLSFRSSTFVSLLPLLPCEMIPVHIGRCYLCPLC